jgi:hypothetical protein
MINQDQDPKQESNLKNLINLSTQTEIPIFNKNKKIKNKDTILKECDKIKKTELKKTSLMLSNLAKLNSYDEKKKDFVEDVQLICQNLENKITNVEKMISIVKILDIPEIKSNKTSKKKNEKDDQYIECYSNYNDNES